MIALLALKAWILRLRAIGFLWAYGDSVAGSAEMARAEHEAPGFDPSVAVASAGRSTLQNARSCKATATDINIQRTTLLYMALHGSLRYLNRQWRRGGTCDLVPHPS